MLTVDQIDTYYGKSHILHDVSLEIKEDEVVALIGRNGVGKTTTMRSIMGMTPPRSGTITFEGEDITGADPNHIASRGIGYAPQERRMFPKLTVMENLEMGAGTGSFEDDQLETVFDLFPRLEERQDQQTGTLSGGEQQMVAMARAMIRDPQLVLLDEPTEGLMPALIPEISDVIETIADRGYAVLLVEQNVDFVLDICDRAYLMDNGRIEQEATSERLQEDPGLLEETLGLSH
ncbi:ABC transporter ATP-binding protein [Haloglomus litoreum]|uniref:ABC transporter ATP-binding protein n=1 Tax=Haloglomus litoreum TaxID=3034026 RepID=UPI0023E86FE8|nr:ABC transporter ATP-binding protein [Haloglomus sp. DT116]